VNSYCLALGGFGKIHQTNAHLFSLYANNIFKYSGDKDRLKMAIGWIDGVIKNNKNDPELPQFLQIKKSLQYKLEATLRK